VLAVVAVVLASAPACARSATLTLAEAAYVCDPADSTNSRLLLSFPVPPALRNSTIDLAVLELEVAVEGSDAGISTSIFPTTRDWSADTVVWDEDWDSGEGAWDARQGTYCDIASGSRVRAAADVTAPLQHWVSRGGELARFVVVPSRGTPGFVAGIIGGGVARIHVRYSAARR
jgi:hypothetical protein